MKKTSLSIFLIASLITGSSFACTGFTCNSNKDCRDQASQNGKICVKTNEKTGKSRNVPPLHCEPKLQAAIGDEDGDDACAGRCECFVGEYWTDPEEADSQ